MQRIALSALVANPSGIRGDEVAREIVDNSLRMPRFGMIPARTWRSPCYR
jgi:hypothetical protein